MRHIISHRDQAELVLPWRTALGEPPPGLPPTLTRVPHNPLDGTPEEHPAIDSFQEFLDSSLTSRDPAEALQEYLTVWRPEDRVHYDVLQRYVGLPPTGNYPYEQDGQRVSPSEPREPYAVVSYPPGYELDAEDPRPGLYYSRRRRR